jgi:hypothetical protein
MKYKHTQKNNFFDINYITNEQREQLQNNAE